METTFSPMEIPDITESVEDILLAEQPSYDIAALLEDIAGVPSYSDVPTRRKKTRDYYWFSPILTPLMNRYLADLVVCPRTEDEVKRVAAACARHRVPLTVRGGGTGNYGAAVPIRGGVVLETTGLREIKWIENGRARVQAGATLWDVDQAARAQGWEVRIFPSTKRQATVGGFYGGGSVGCGSVMHGGLREPGNLLALRVISVEEEPQAIELRDAETGQAARTYGATGIITELEIPLDPARSWRDVIVAFPTLDATVSAGYALTTDASLIKKQLSLLDAQAAAIIKPMGIEPPAGHPVLLSMVAPESLAAFQAKIESFGGKFIFEDDSIAADASTKRTPLYEFGFGHATLHLLSKIRPLASVQIVVLQPNINEKIAQATAYLGDEAFLYGEFFFYDGRASLDGSMTLRYTTAERIREVMAFLEGMNIPVSNPHTFTVESSRYKRVEGDQDGFKRRVDPLGLCNPGKMLGA
jgi:FAD/FMN-containing dehydrogenase